MKHLEEADAEDGTQDGGLLMLNTSLKSLGNCDPPLELVIPQNHHLTTCRKTIVRDGRMIAVCHMFCCFAQDERQAHQAKMILEAGVC